MRKATWSSAIVLALAACSGGGGGGGPIGNGGPPAVAGTYNATFTAAQVNGNCQGLITAGDMTTNPFLVTQSGTSVTLQITSLHPALRSNPVGTISESGIFNFDGVVLVGDPDDPGSQAFSADGTFDGTFSGSSVNIGFDFTLATCNVVGTIIGTRT